MNVHVVQREIVGTTDFLQADPFVGLVVGVVRHADTRTFKTRFGERQFYRVSVASEKGVGTGFAAWRFLEKLVPEEVYIGVLQRRGQTYLLAPPPRVSEALVKKIREQLEVPF